MQRLEEDTSSNGLFVSTFIVRAEQIGPSTVWSDDCGLGWLFGIKQDSVKSGLEQTAGVFVFSKLCGSFLQGLQYRVTLTLCTHKEDEGSGLGISVVEKEEKGGWPSESNTARVVVSTTLSPLPTSRFRLATFKMDVLRENSLLTCAVSVEQASSATTLIASPAVPSITLPGTLLTGRAVDLKYWTFTQRCRVRNENGLRVLALNPKAVYANSIVLKDASEHFYTSLSPNGFQEDSLTDIFSAFPESANTMNEKYDYESDSDLEDLKTSENIPTQTSCQAIDKEGRENSHFSQSQHSDTTRLAEAMTKHAHMGRVVVLKNTAFRTWYALIFYLYTGRIGFCPLRSSGGSVSHSLDGHDTQNPSKSTPLCSPKSMYRLADEYGMEELKRKAFAAIKERITPLNVVEEAFSEFTSWYPEVRDMEIELLQKHFLEDEVFKAYSEKLRAAFGGDHAADMVVSFTKALSKRA